MKLDTSLLVLLATGTMASVNVVDNLAHDLRMNLLPRQRVNNLQAFTSGLGGAGASAITQSNDATRQFEVDGDTFNDFQSAANRACDNQHNECANLANSKQGAFSVQDCDQQSSQCKSSINSASKQSFVTLVSSDDDFDIFCES